MHGRTRLNFVEHNLDLVETNLTMITTSNKLVETGPKPAEMRANLAEANPNLVETSECPKHCQLHFYYNRSSTELAHNTFPRQPIAKQKHALCVYKHDLLRTLCSS